MTAPWWIVRCTRTPKPSVSRRAPPDRAGVATAEKDHRVTPEAARTGRRPRPGRAPTSPDQPGRSGRRTQTNPWACAWTGRARRRRHTTAAIPAAVPTTEAGHGRHPSPLPPHTARRAMGISAGSAGLGRGPCSSCGRRSDRGMSGSDLSLPRRESVSDRLRVAVEEWPFAFRRLGLEGPAVSHVARDHVEMEVEDRLEGGFAVAKKDVDSIAAHARAPQGSCHVTADRPNVSARGSAEVFEARRVLARHDEKMAGRDGVEVHEDHDGLVLVHHTGLGLSGRDGTEDTPLRRRCRVPCHTRNSPSASGQVLFSYGAIESRAGSAERSGVEEQLHGIVRQASSGPGGRSAALWVRVRRG